LIDKRPPQFRIQGRNTYQLIPLSLLSTKDKVVPHINLTSHAVGYET